MRKFFFNIVMILGLTTFALPALPGAVNAIDPALKEQACSGANFGATSDCNAKAGDFTSGFNSIINILIFLVGAIAVLMLIIGAIRFVTSAGNDQAVAGARNTILYAIIGIIVAFLAYAIVNFVIAKL